MKGGNRQRRVVPRPQITASMRPPFMKGGNGSTSLHCRAKEETASMRPPFMKGGNRRICKKPVYRCQASMRPPFMKGGNVGMPIKWTSRLSLLQ